MIRVRRGREPAAVGAARLTHLPRIRRIACARAPTSREINGYDIAAEVLWHRQFHKCCYCETRLHCVYNDVEHYRPKARGDRRPGSSFTHGYWWLAWNWSNMLFACANCNRSGKNDSFPLKSGSGVLHPEADPPGGEVPLLLDPAGRTNPATHIQFKYEPVDPRLGGPPQWCARPRGASERGDATINVLRLNHSNLLDMRRDHVETVVRREADLVLAALTAGTRASVRAAVRRATEIMTSRHAYALLARDAMELLVPPSAGVTWPLPSQVPLRTP